MKHFGEYLPLSGRVIKQKSQEIAGLMEKREAERKRLDEIEDEILRKEQELLKLMNGEWTKEEIEEAQLKAVKYNYSIKIKK